jgi:hypothetical protein
MLPRMMAAAPLECDRYQKRFEFPELAALLDVQSLQVFEIFF